MPNDFLMSMVSRCFKIKAVQKLVNRNDIFLQNGNFIGIFSATKGWLIDSKTRQWSAVYI